MVGRMDIKNPKVLKLKGILFLALGLLSAGMVLWKSPDGATLALLAIAVWAFCRFYYFAFYVLHEYADSFYRYSGLIDLTMYLLGSKKAGSRRRGDDPRE